MPSTTTSSDAELDVSEGGRWRLAGALGWDGHSERTGNLTLTVAGGVCQSLNDAPEPSGQLSGLVLIPLLVNGHDHGRGHGNVAAGIPDAALEPWLGHLRAAPPSSQAELVGVAGRQLIGSGAAATVLCVNPQRPDVWAEVSAAVAAATRAGLRAAIAVPLSDTGSDPYGRARDAEGWSPAEVAGWLAAFEDLAHRTDGGSIELQLGPVGPQWVSETTLRAVADHARRHNRRVHMHLLESRVQRSWADRTYPEGIVPWLGRIGLLGQHLCVAHGTHLRAPERTALAAAGVVVTVNPSSNLRLASGIPPVDGLIDGSGPLSCGLDGMALGDDHDYWTELRLLRGLYQAQSGRHPDGWAFLERLLTGGRQALGAAAPAAPGPGRPADFALIELGHYRHLWKKRGWSLADTVLSAARPALVTEVWVAGRRVDSTGDRPAFSGGDC